MKDIKISSLKYSNKLKLFGVVTGFIYAINNVFAGRSYMPYYIQTYWVSILLILFIIIILIIKVNKSKKSINSDNYESINYLEDNSHLMGHDFDDLSKLSTDLESLEKLHREKIEQIEGVKKDNLIKIKELKDKINSNFTSINTIEKSTDKNKESISTRNKNSEKEAKAIMHRELINQR
jgi:hypothetical protein